MNKLSIVIPVYNEERTLKEVVNEVLKVKLPNKISKEIIIVDDGSVDNSKNILKKINHKNVKVFFNKFNQGKGATLLKGFKHCTGDLVIVQDADLEYDPNEYGKLIEAMKNKNADVIYGSRFLNKNNPVSYRHFALGNYLLSFMTSILYFQSITDMETCYKLFKSHVLQNIELESKRFDFEPEVTAKILKKGFKLYEVPITYKPRSIEEGKKINWKDGVYALYLLLKYRVKK
ncbi:MAG: glycosyltransferase family 2 protein [archaeon]